jgi:thymidylate synthase ThyX
MTPAGQKYLEQAITNTQGNVYAFYYDQLNPVTVAAAMARLSRRGDDMRLTLLDEFAHAMGKDEQLIKRVITAYGDDSVQQLVGTQFVVENASNLLTKKIEWGRLAAYLEQSTRYIYFDERDENGNYRYYVPPQLNATTKNEYCEIMDDIFALYSTMVRDLFGYVSNTSDVPKSDRDGAWRAAVRAQACDAARAVLPVATKSTVGIIASGQALENMIIRLMADSLPEARQTGLELLEEARIPSEHCRRR